MADPAPSISSRLVGLRRIFADPPSASGWEEICTVFGTVAEGDDFVPLLDYALDRCRADLCSTPRRGDDSQLLSCGG